MVFYGNVKRTYRITIASAFVLAETGIAVQNFPEGAIISMPLVGTGMSKMRAFVYGTLSGAVEPVRSSAHDLAGVLY